MGKTGRWIKHLLTGKRDKTETISVTNANDHHHHHHRPTTPISTTQPTTPREKRRWSFRRSSATAPGKHDSSSVDNTPHPLTDHHALAVATAAAADAAVAAAKAAAAVVELTGSASSYKASAASDDAAASKIQAVFRGYLARKALNALKGLVKLQALVRGHLVRKQATATLRCMQALVSVQARARAQRLRMAEETKFDDQRNFNHRKSLQENRFRSSNQDYERGLEENIKIVEMDLGEYKGVTRGRSSYSNHTQTERFPTKQEHDYQQQMSAISPRTCSNHFEEYSAQSSPQCYSANAMSKPDIPPPSEYAESLYSEYSFYPNYMANTQSSRAKVRSQSAPKQRPAETFERQLSKRRPSIEGRNVPRAVRMQRSSSHLASAPHNSHYPWSLKLDRSAVSLKESECGSTSTVLTNTIYCRSLIGFEVQGGGSRY